MRSNYWLLAGVLLSGSAYAVPQYGQGPASAQGGYVPGAQRAAPADNPAIALRAGIDRLLGFLGSEQRPDEQRLAVFLNTEIAPFFDFEYMARSAGGRLFEQLDGAGQRALADNIKASFLSRMADKLAGYGNQQVRFLPPRAGNDGRTAQVSVAILNPGSYPARMDFRLYRDGGQWRVYDVAANGQSAIVHYRRELMRQMQQQQMQQMRRMQQMTPSVRQVIPRGPYGR